MRPPIRADLPFFAYGVFKPEQIAYFRLKSHVSSVSVVRALSGDLYVRDGLLIADSKGSGHVSGNVLHFRPTSFASAYQAIVDLEPDNQYVWGEALVGTEMVNILWGKKPSKGSHSLDYEWDSWADPLFTSALDVINETTEVNRQFKWDFKNTFRLQMAYLLLWSSIERYTSLRYHLGNKATAKVNNLATEPAFGARLATLAPAPREINRTDVPGAKVTLAANDSRAALAYYYQLRSNLVHRGKGIPNDHSIILHSLNELIDIFRHVLIQARRDATVVT